MSNNPLISVIIPVYNVENYIEKCAISLINQTYQNCEFIFINDGTKDKSIEILEQIEDNRIKILNQENQGVSAARNAGLDIANGEYIAFVDADDYVASDYIEYLYRLISTNNADYAYTTNIFQSKNEQQINNDDIQIVNSNKSVGILLSPDVVVGCYNKIYKKSIIDINKLRFRSDLYYGEGLNFIIRMSIISEKIVVGKRKILYYRKNNMFSATTKYNNDKYHNGLKSLKIIEELIPIEDEFVKSMFLVHISTFYLGAITQMIENKKVNEYKNDFIYWKTKLKSNKKSILKSKDISFYRKIMLIIGIRLPYLIAYLDKMRRNKKIKESVD